MALVCGVIATLVVAYFALALSALRNVPCDGRYSLFHPDPRCRTPEVFAWALLASIGCTVFLTIGTVRSYRRDRSHT